MKVGLLCAGDMEFAPVLAMLDNASTTEKSMLKFYDGKLAGVNVVTLFSGVCKVNAAIAAQNLIDYFHCDAIINVGTAGGMDERLDIFDLVVSSECGYHDVDVSILTEFHPWLDSIFMPADPDLLAIAKSVAQTWESEHSVYFGRMMTGEKFITDEQRPAINIAYAPLSVDMETAAIAHVCFTSIICHSSLSAQPPIMHSTVAWTPLSKTAQLLHIQQQNS